MNKKTIISLITILVVIIGFIAFYFITNKSELMFKKDYESYNNKKITNENETEKLVSLKISNNNPIVYLNDENVLDKIKLDSEMILIGKPDDNITRKILPTLFEAAKDNGIEEIYYYPLGELEKKYEKNNQDAVKIYEEIIKISDKYIDNTFKSGNKKGKKKITSPTVIVVNKGKIVSLHQGSVSSDTNYFENLTQEQKNELYKIYENMILDLIMCTDDC